MNRILTLLFAYIAVLINIMNENDECLHGIQILDDSRDTNNRWNEFKHRVLMGKSIEVKWNEMDDSLYTSNFWFT